MTNFFAFDIICNTDDLEELLAEAITDGFSGYSEIEINGKIKVNICYDNEKSANEIHNYLAQKYEISAVSKIENRDWNEEWKKTITPVKITDNIWVSPSWLTPEFSLFHESWIKIEPRMAFGTGHHETTRLAAKLIEKTDGKTLLDIGTGSGVLAFVAQISGYNSIIGVEIDEDCRENLAENLEDNKGHADIRFIIGGIEKIHEEAKFDTVVMNMIRSQSAPLLFDICKIINKNGNLLWSGILCTERDLIVEEAAKFGFELQSEITEGEWWGGKFLKK